MKYRLANSIITDNYIEQLLKERGVEDFESFMSPNENCLINPKNLDNIENGANLLLSILNDPNHQITFIVDCDVDGFTSSTILWRYIKDFYPEANLNYKIHNGKQHGLKDLMNEFKDSENLPTLVILPDASSNDYEEHRILRSLGVEILVLDHHEAPYESESAVVINNQLSPEYENKDLTGAGVVWQFCRYLDMILSQNFAEQYIDLAALGIISDMANVLTLENRYIIKKGLSHVNNFFFKVLVDKQAFSLGSQLTPIGVSFYITPLINALIRVGTTQEKENLFLSFLDGTQIVPSTKRGEKGLTEKLAVQMARAGTNARNHQKTIKEDAVNALDIKIHKYDLLENKILFVILDENNIFPSELNGLIAMELAAKYKRPTIVARLNDQEEVKGSIRGLNESELKDFKSFLQNSSLFDYVEGHPNAAGCSILKKDIRKLHEYANTELENINFNENMYEVNFIKSAFDSELKTLIEDLSKAQDTYGQMNSEPLILIENLHINKSKMISIMGKNSDTVKLTYNNIAYMFFRAKDFIEELNSQPNLFDLNIIGKANLNEYYGTVTPQIFVENYEISPTSLFDF